MATAPPPYGANTGGDKAGYPPAAGGYAQPPPPQAGYPYQPPYAGYGTTSSSAVVVSQPVMTTVQQFREAPVRTKCPGCQADVVTATEYKTGWMSWAACGIIILFGGILGCCLIPFCINAVKDVVHTCPNCKLQIAIWHRFS